MGVESIPARFAQPVEWRKVLSVWWGEGCPDRDSGHRAEKVIVTGERIPPRDWPWPPARSWPRECSCGARVDYRTTEGRDASRSIGTSALWDTPTGDLEPGCLYWMVCPAVDQHGPYCSWDNCEGRHLYGVVPDGSHWNIDGRAGNCEAPDDRTHRCWVRAGDPPDVTVSKGSGAPGETCGAGGGSIDTGTWHAFLRAGVWGD